jgi:acetate kinase
MMGRCCWTLVFSAAEIATPSQAQHIVADWLSRQIRDDTIVGVGHRVVHGGPVYSQPVLIDNNVLATLETFIPLAPLHQLTNLDPIRALRDRHPDLPQVACFDTAFRRGHPELSQRCLRIARKQKPPCGYGDQLFLFARGRRP